MVQKMFIKKDTARVPKNGGTMKKLLALILAMIMLFSLAACGKQETPAAPNEPATPDAPVVEPDVSEPEAAPIDSIPVDEITSLFMDMYTGEGLASCMNEAVTEDLVANLLGAESFSCEFESAQALVPMMMTSPFVLMVFRLAEGADTEAFAADLKAAANPQKWVCVCADEVETVISGRTVLFYMCPAEMKEGLNACFAEMCKADFVPEEHIYNPFAELDMNGFYAKLYETLSAEDWGFMDNADVVTSPDALVYGDYGLSGIDSSLYTEALFDDGYMPADEIDIERSYVLALFRLAEGVDAAEFAANVQQMVDNTALKGEEIWGCAAYSEDVVAVYVGGGAYSWVAGGLESVLMMEFRMTSTAAQAGIM